MSPPGRPAIVAGQAPVLIIPDFFEAELCERLIGYWRADHHEGTVARGTLAKSGHEAEVVDLTLKSRLDCRPDKIRDRELRQLLARRMSPVVFKAFQFEIAYVDAFYIGAYSDARQDYFRPHRDNATATTQHRRFAVSVNLNDDYDGGCLRFAEWGGELYRPAAGGAIVFSCSLLHEALPVTRGTRYVALTFLSGPEDVARAKAGQPPAARHPLAPV